MTTREPPASPAAAPSASLTSHEQDLRIRDRRTAGALLGLTGLLVFLRVAAEGAPTSVVAPIGLLVIGFRVTTGEAKAARQALLALLVISGGVAASWWSKGGPATTAVYVLLGVASLALSLWESAAPRWRKAGHVLYAPFFLVMALGIYADSTGRRPWNEWHLRALGRIEPLADGNIVGRKSAYTLTVPNGWFQQNGELAGGQEWHLLQPDANAHLVVTVVQASAGTELSTDKVTEILVLRKHKEDTVVEDGRVPGGRRIVVQSRAGRGRVMYHHAVYAYDDVAVHLRGAVDTVRWKDMSAEFDAIAGSFRPPADALTFLDNPVVRLAGGTFALALPSTFWWRVADAWLARHNVAGANGFARPDLNTRLLAITSEVDPGMRRTEKKYAEDVLSATRGTVDDVKDLSWRKAEGGQVVEFRARTGDEWHHHVMLVGLSGGQALTLNFVSPEAQWGAAEVDVDAIVSSVRRRDRE